MEQLFTQHNGLLMIIVALVTLVWLLPWKGVALWKAARNRHLKWFIAILVLNTLAILDIFYIFVVAKKAEKKGISDDGRADSSV